MKKNGKINAKQVILLVVVVLFIGYELLFAGGNEQPADTPAESPVQSLAVEPSQSVEDVATGDELLYSEESSSPVEESSSLEAPSVEEYLSFRNEELWESHYEKHGIDMGFASMEEYLEAANLVLYNEDTLHKIEAEDGDDVYFLEETGEFVVVSTDGYIRTYFIPDAGIDYFNRQ
ncbi:MAG: hypothetical protein IJZ82_10595 [Lachnospiraceae bacterium]|nr:hypothetical protein [Lachnospiraceae bacterium]